jgi:tetratricopeptide (TPR) repeat protein
VLAGASLVSLLLVSHPLVPDQGPSLVTAAAASGRPRECMSTVRGGLSRRPTIWQLARTPELGRYCDLVARAKSQLASDPKAAAASAKDADTALPGRAAPRVLLARAAFAQGKVDDAAREFEAARTIDARSVEDPSTMHDLAEVLRKTGKLDDALATYRALVPRIDLLPGSDRRVLVLLEAAHVSMTVAGKTAATTGSKPSLDEALAYLREARQRPPTALANDVLLSLALTLDRSGDRVQADAVLADVHAPSAESRPALDYLAVTEDKSCLDALLAAPADAVKSWEAYLATSAGKGPFAAAARARLDAAKKSGKTK